MREAARSAATVAVAVWPWTGLVALMWIAATPAFAQSGAGSTVHSGPVGEGNGRAPIAAPLADCQRIIDALSRLSCYDAAVGRPVLPPALSNPPPAPLPTLTEPVVPARPRQVELDALALPPSAGPVARATLDIRRSIGTTLTERWELDEASDRGRFLIRPYKPIVVMPFEWTSQRNPLPSSTNPANVVTEPQRQRSTEAKFQISLKSKLWENMLGTGGNLWGAYTQTSYWQIFNIGESRPFRETNYEPEVMAVYPVSRSVLGWQTRLVGLGINHQSNGRSAPLSRSWNRIIGMVGLERQHWMMMVRPWWRLPEERESDDNPDIADHVGRADLLLVHEFGGHQLSFLGRHTLRTGSRSRGSLQIDYAFPITSYLKANLQVFTGYGASLIDYNIRQTRVGLGISLVNWL